MKIHIPKHTFIIIPMIFKLIVSDDLNDDTTTEKTFTSCREKIQQIGSDKTEQYELINVELNETLILECHYCGENDDSKPKNWYISSPKNVTVREVPIDMHKNESLNRISVTLDHELVIHHVIQEDYGTYFCRNLQESETENFLNYIVESLLNFGPSTIDFLKELCLMLQFRLIKRKMF